MAKYVSKPLKVDTSDMSVEDQLKFYIKAGKSVMLHGPSGVGKSRRVQEIDPYCVLIQLRDGILPEEVIGKTFFDGEDVHWIEPIWYSKMKKICAAEPNKNHVLFIDELTNVKPQEQSLVYDIVMEHSIFGNQGKLPENCVIIAAGNSPEESEAAYTMPEPLFRRFSGHITLEPNVRSFCEWGSEMQNGRPKVHPLVRAFVSEFAEDVFYSKYDNEGVNEYALDPRGWERVSNIIYNNDEVLQFELLANKMGQENAKSFMNFARRMFITPEDIVRGCYSQSDIPYNKDSQHALVCTLRNVSPDDREAAENFVSKNFGVVEKEILESLWREDDQKSKNRTFAEDKILED